MNKLIEKYLSKKEIAEYSEEMQMTLVKHRQTKDKTFVNVEIKSAMSKFKLMTDDEKRALREKEQREEVEAKRVKLLKAFNIFKQHMPPKFEKATLKPMTIGDVVSPNQVRVIKEFKSKGLFSKPKDTLLLGSSGIGKTHLSVALAKHYLRLGMSCRFVQDDDYVKFVKENSYYAKEFQTCKVLILDDIAGDDDYGRIASWQSKDIRKLIYDRADRGLVTIVSSNFTKEQLHKYLGHRVWSRFTSDFTEGNEFAFVDFGDRAGLRGVA